MKNRRPANAIFSFFEKWAEQQPTWLAFLVAALVFGCTYSIIDSLVKWLVG